MPETEPETDPDPDPEPEEDPEPPPIPRARIQMAGDILLHANPVSTARTANGYDFSSYFEMIAPYLDGDLSIVDMETPVDAFGNNEQLASYPSFNVPYEILTALKDAGFDMVVTATNHAFDKGLSGLINTRNNIIKAGLLVTGTNETKEQYDEYFIIDINGLKVGIIAYSSIDNGLSPLIPADIRPYVMRRFDENVSSAATMAEDMQRCRAAGADMIIMSLHWGAEYQNRPDDGQIALARRLVELGADVVMGNHVHCVQPIEWHPTDRGDRLIIYSLGNFFADQYGLDPQIPKTQYGMLVTVTATLEDGELFLEADYLPTFVHRFTNQPSPTGFGYRLLPVWDREHLEASVRPDFLRDDDGWRRYKEAYSHVTSVAGSDVPVYSQ